MTSEQFLAVLAFITAFIVLITAFLSLRKEVKQVHVLVNDRLDAALERIEQQSATHIALSDRIDQLTEALLKSDTEVPDEPV